MKPRPANRLRMRKGRSVMHKSLEDNYGAVVVANHEALAQVLEQVCAQRHKAATNLITSLCWHARASQSCAGYSIVLRKYAVKKVKHEDIICYANLI